MFGGTPSNLGMTFLETDRVEVITGVNLPMLIKLAQPAQLAGSARASRARCASTGATRSGWRRICCAGTRRVTYGRRLHGATDDDVASRDRREPAGHARAGGGEVRPPGDAVPVAGPRGARRARDGRQEHHGHPAAGGGARHRRSRSPPTARTSSDAVDALVRAGRSRDSARTHAAPDRHRRLAGRRRRAARWS